MKILVTGFEPFEDEPLNPSWETVRRLPDTIGDSEPYFYPFKRILMWARRDPNGATRHR